MKDLIIGAVTKYKYKDIKNWVNSINRSGFEGDVVVIASDIDQDVVNELKSNNVRVVMFDSQDNIVIERFSYYWDILSKIPREARYRFVIATDVSDVVFQQNPSKWLENNLTSKLIVASSESIRYNDELWGKNNMMSSFGTRIFEEMKDKVINNAGVMAGHFDVMKDLFLNIYLSCGGSPRYVEGGGGPDQAAYNILLSLAHYRNITLFANSEDLWAAQLGTTKDPNKIGYYSQFLTEPSPIIDYTGNVCNSQGHPFFIVHQYNRVPEWKQIIDKKYS